MSQENLNIQTHKTEGTTTNGNKYIMTNVVNINRFETESPGVRKASLSPEIVDKKEKYLADGKFKGILKDKHGEVVDVDSYLKSLTVANNVGKKEGDLGAIMFDDSPGWETICNSMIDQNLNES